MLELENNGTNHPNVIVNEKGTFTILLLASKNYKYNTAAKQGVRTTERIELLN